MGTRCKVSCIETGQSTTSVYNHELKKSEPRVVHTAKFCAVSDGSEENKAFFASTPNLQLSTGTLNGQHFEAGKNYYLDISPAD